MKYNVGDRVRIKSIDWYNENKNKKGFIYFDYANFTPVMSQYCGEILTIKRVMEEFERYHVSECAFSWTDEMIEGLVEEGTKSLTTEKMDKVIEEAKTYWDSIKDAWICPQGYQFVDENGNVINAMKIVLEKKKNEYPKTYEECAEIIAELTGSDCNPKGCMGYMSVQLTALQKLLICRDAYWKLYGEEMGLDGPWKPDYKNENQKKYCIYNRDGIAKGVLYSANSILAFPTADMRDAFFENFKELIEQCKGLL